MELRKITSDQLNLINTNGWFNNFSVDTKFELLKVCFAYYLSDFEIDYLNSWHSLLPNDFINFRVITRLTNIANGSRYFNNIEDEFLDLIGMVFEYDYHNYNGKELADTLFDNR